MTEGIVSLSSAQARRIALRAQGFGVTQPATRIDRRHLRRTMSHQNLLQLDSVPAVCRPQNLVLFSRLGYHDIGLLDQVAYQDDEWFEAWAHEASLMPTSTEPFLRWQKARSQDGATWGGLVRLAQEEPAYVAEVLAQVAERPLQANQLSDVRPQSGEWWGSRSLGQLALDWLFRIGKVGIRRRGGFNKEFDLLERIVPAETMAVATPTEDDAIKELLRRSARAHGVATAHELADYYRLPIRDARRLVEELAEDGALIRASVQGFSKPAFLSPDVTRAKSITTATLLSPFDPVVWHRDRASALFDFDYRIEIYVPAAKRKYGYYVLPLLVDDQIVGRIDAKTDRAANTFRVLGAWAENGVKIEDVADRIRPALQEFARFVGVDQLEIVDRGDLAPALRAIRG